MSRPLEGMFLPKSIAIVGASESPLKVGAIVLKNIIVSGYKGKIFPINPTISEYGGLKFYRNVTELPATPDLVVIAIPARAVSQVLVECGKTGVKNVVIFSSGYKEVGEEGKVMEAELIDIATKYDLNILGPNCMGFADTKTPLNVTFGQSEIERGSLKLVTQSGSLAASLFDWCETTKLGFDSFVTIGNKAVIDELDILENWLPQLTTSEQEKIIPVGMYLESINNGVDLVNTIKKITPHNPIFILKPGRSKNAARAMQSHTGAIAGEDKIFEAAVTQAGAIRCDELGDFFDLSMTLSWSPVPRGPKVAIVTNAGGPSVIASDSINKYGMEMAVLGEDTKNKLRDLLPKMASVQNPIDVLGDALSDRFESVLTEVLKDNNVDTLLVVLTPQLMTQVEKTATAIGRLALMVSKPIYCSFVGGQKVENGREILSKHKVTNFDFPERAVKTMATIWNWEKWRQAQPKEGYENDSTLKIDIDTIQTALAKFDKEKIMSVLGVSTPAIAVVTSKNEAGDFAQTNGWPVVMKIRTPEILHKSDVGGVKMNIRNQAELETAFDEISLVIENLQRKYNDPIKIEIQSQIGNGVEVILGVKRDQAFGITILFGAGGKYAEILNDHSLISWPASRKEVEQIVKNSRIYKLLSGYRDDKAYDLTNLYSAISGLGQLMSVFEVIKEMEINPLTITHEKSWAVDIKIVQ